ncbi:S-layer homology domain [Syntrophomonas zehnderi OL-4]|uniref:S-layer homology domain n=1 Tax=Syntrophomonas zehnderi OL-4 TaxID=690567 RepID=A0A0E3W3J9_9FIRM|nr:S-layer homology domain-containing protein [Syntrophomonas zehnderi]CFX88171.1 S-layer homology domain [Syntrophomonas zehnderi OL-4]
MNYFYNKSADPDLKVLGRNDKNADCVRVYEKDSGKLVSTSARLISDDSDGDEMNTFYTLDGTQKSETKKRTLVVALNEKLAGNTTYKVVINREMAANNSAILGQEKVIEFTTEASTATNSGGGKAPITDQAISALGGRISESGVTIVIPANAVSSDIKVTVEKIIDTASLPLNNKSSFISYVVEIIKDKAGDFSKPVTITLSFNKSNVDSTKYDLLICYLDEKENKWIPLDNVKVDLAAGTVSGEVSHFTKFAVMAVEKEQKPEPKPVPELKDIKGHWAEKAITELVATGAIGGYPDATFQPDKNISRAEFASILVKAFKLEAGTGKIFADTADHWAKDSIAIAASYGIVSGYSTTKFGPDDKITREQMAAMIVKAAKLAESTEGKNFADSNKISPWAKTAVATASQNKIINGYPDSTFRPQAQASRAEAATVIIQALKTAS